MIAKTEFLAMKMISLNESGSDFEQDDSCSDHSFDSETDSEEDMATQSSLGTLDSDSSQVTDPDFWSDQLTDIELTEFAEPIGPTHTLPKDAPVLEFFRLVFPLCLIQLMTIQTNLYAAQNMAQGWVDTTEEEMSAFIGMQIIMGINQLPRYTMYWSNDPFLGKCLIATNQHMLYPSNCIIFFLII